MASISTSAPDIAPPSTSPRLPCIKAFYLNDATSAAVLSVAQAVKHDQEESGQRCMLAAKTLVEAKTWSTVAISSSSWAKVSELRTQLTNESDSLISLVSTINPSALYLYSEPMVVQLNKGVAPLKSFLTMEEDCGLVVPLSASDDVLVTAWDETRGEETYRLALEGCGGKKAFVMSGTSKLRVVGDEPLVCVVFCLAAGREG